MKAFILICICLMLAGCETEKQRQEAYSKWAEEVGYKKRVFVFEGRCPVCKHNNKRVKKQISMEYHGDMPYQVDCDKCHNAYWVSGREEK